MRNLARAAAIIGTLALAGWGCAPATPRNANVNLPRNTNGVVGSTLARPASGTMTVHITTTGQFIPTTAFVTKGTVVTWVNDDAKPHQPAVVAGEDGKIDVQFGAPKPLKPGETYSFTFEKEGRYIYEDKVNPSFSGAIDVVP